MNHLDDWLWQKNDETETYSFRTPRAICPQCERPTPSTCYCPALPHPALQLHRSHCLVLQHPHELRRKNRSLPIVQHSIDPDHLTVVIGRRFDVASGNALSQILEAQCRSKHPQAYHQTWLVFPGPQAISLSTALQRLKKLEEEKQNVFVTVVFLDATWQYACEMDRTLQERNQYPQDIVRISIDLDDLEEESFHPRRFDIRKARADDQFCTAEAISRVLAALEQNNEIHTALMKPLDLMVSQWNAFRYNKQKEVAETTDSS
jgi:DTW domain-containing protein YfiP